MSLPITILLVLVAILSAALSMRIFRGPTGHNAFTGLSIGFIAAVAAAFIFGDHDPNSGTAILAGVVTAFVVTPLVTFLSFLVHRAIKGPRG